MKNVICAVLLVAASIVPALAAEVGFSRFMTDDPMGGRMRVSLWYPTNEQNGTVVAGPFTFPATRDAEPINGQLGLVVISHGTAGSDLGHRNVAIALARAGHVVAAPLHPRDNFEDDSGVGRRVVMEGRPLQVTAVVDALLTHPEWRERIDARRIGAFGFSLGGYTMLAVLGAMPDISNVIDHCETATTDPFCIVVGARGGSPRRQFGQEYQIPLANTADSRFCAASIADPVAVPFSNEALAGITARYIQVWRPEEQNALLAEAHASRVVRQLNKRKSAEKTREIIVEGAQHYSFLAPFPSKLQSVLPVELTRDSPDFDRTKFQMRFATEVAEYLLRSLEQCVQRN